MPFITEYEELPAATRTIPQFECVYLTDSDAEWRTVSCLLKPVGIRVHHAALMEQAALLLIRTEALVLLADLSFFDCSWQEAKKLLDREVPRVALVLAADCPDETLWIDVLEHGVYDLVSRPFLLEELRRVLENANAHARYLPRGQHGRVAGAA